MSTVCYRQQDEAEQFITIFPSLCIHVNTCNMSHLVIQCNDTLIMSLHFSRICIALLISCSSVTYFLSKYRIQSFSERNQTISQLNFWSERPRNNSRAGTPSDLRDLFRGRLERLEEACEGEERRSRSLPKVYKFNVAPEQRLIMCKQAKHGTTTLSQYFVQILTDG